MRTFSSDQYILELQQVASEAITGKAIIILSSPIHFEALKTEVSVSSLVLGQEISRAKRPPEATVELASMTAICGVFAFPVAQIISPFVDKISIILPKANVGPIIGEPAWEDALTKSRMDR